MQGSWWKVHPETYVSIILLIALTAIEPRFVADILLLLAALVGSIRASKWPKQMNIVVWLVLIALLAVALVNQMWIAAVALVLVAIPMAILKRLRVALAMRRFGVAQLWAASVCGAFCF